MPGTTSKLLLARLNTLPRLTVPAVALFLLLVGLMARPLFAVPSLALLIALVGWLASLAWSQSDLRGRAVRLAVLVILVAVALVRLLEGIGW